MRYTITSTQLNFFRKEGQIEFEDLYSSIEIVTLKALLEQTLAVANTGRDLHRGNAPLLDALHTSRLGQVASGLFGKKRLRFVFTQFGNFFEGVRPIEQISSMTETCGGCVLNLHTGVATFYSAQFPLDFAKLEPPYLLVVFATDKARYRLQDSDPCTHLLKRLGYGFGDLITEETHPLIVK
ncbi:MAG: hypothetical protein JSS30_00135 [Verrucomicrobia bacterium]|nr:hypothetical protein [Verrucomicrobiota bacterium]